MDRITPDTMHNRVCQQRFWFAQAISAALVSLLLAFVPAPRFDVALPRDPVLEVSLKPDETLPEDLPRAEALTPPAADQPEATSTAVAESTDDKNEPVESDRTKTAARIDWYAKLKDIAERSDQFLPDPASMSATFDEKRRRAGLRFAASTAPVKKPVWENVEMDQMGRKLLWHDNCYRVIEDNAVTRRWVQENFTQYLVFCNGPEDRAPIQIAFSDDRFAGYRYLTDPDGSASGYGR